MASVVFVINTLLLMSLEHVHSQNHSEDAVGCEEECEEDYRLSVRAGEALCVCVVSDICSDCLDIPDDHIYNWTREGVSLTHTHTHSHRVHTHGKALYFLPLTLNDTGLYYLWVEMGCKVCALNITVMDVPLGHKDLQFTTPSTQDTSPSIECPVETSDLCDNGRGKITWYKDSQLLPGESGKIVRVLNAMKSDEGVYTCVCTWQHGTHTFNTSDSTRLELQNASTRLRPTIIHPTNGSTVTCQLGSRVLLECSGSCGISVTQLCDVSWDTHTHTGHTQNLSWEDKGSMRVYKAVLIISEVTQLDLHTHFRCTASNHAEWTSVTVALKQQESLLSVVLVCVGVLLFLLLVAMVVKWFAIDLALLFRSARRTEDGKVYDAYVVYPRECVCGHAVGECVCEEALSVFLSSSLPAVLEDQCGYTLFIHGRDDLPGEDQAEQVERCMRLSRRLLVVMTTLGSAGGQVVAPPLEQFDWQMGLHSSLVQEDMSVIMVQTQMPPGLQLLLKKNAPLRWEMGVRGANCPTSRFWKTVRYMMPPPPP